MRASNLLIVLGTFILSIIFCGRNPTYENPLLIKTNAIDTNITNKSLWVKTDPLIWMFDTSGFSTTCLIISGNTNAKSIGIETHGDGLIGIFPLDLNNNNYFNDTISI
jgi:hypothetical protein